MNMHWTNLVIHVSVFSTWDTSTEEVGSVSEGGRAAGSGQAVSET